MRRLFLPSIPGAVARAVHFAERVAREDGVADEVVDRLALAAGEAVANAAVHGNRLDPLRHVLVEWTPDGGGRLCVEDEGAGLADGVLDAAALPDDPMSTGGRGLFILKALADDVRLEQGGRRVCLRFVPRPPEAS